MVWLVNGLYCKVLNQVPRHEEIVASILGETMSRPLTLLIGLSEIVMAIWIISRYQSKLNAIAQISIILLMNVLEFLLVPQLLLWGAYNFVFATIFAGLIYYTEFVLYDKNIKYHRK